MIRLFRLRLRAFALLLSLTVLGASVGVTVAQDACGPEAALPSSSLPVPLTATDCCGQPLPAATAATAATTDGCCVFKVSFQHLTADAIGPVFAVQFAAPAVLPAVEVLMFGPSWAGGPVGRAIIGTASGLAPPGYPGGVALLRVLHQWRV